MGKPMVKGDPDVRTTQMEVSKATRWDELTYIVHNIESYEIYWVSSTFGTRATIASSEAITSWPRCVFSCWLLPLPWSTWFFSRSNRRGGGSWSQPPSWTHVDERITDGNEQSTRLLRATKGHHFTPYSHLFLPTSWSTHGSPKHDSQQPTSPK